MVTSKFSGLLRMLDKMGYRGAIGLQCYNVSGDIRDNLRRSIEAWRKLCLAQQPVADVAHYGP